MKPTLFEKALAVFVGLLLLTIGVLHIQLQRARDHLRSAGLQADSLAAALDTSHAIALSRRDSIGMLGDSMQAVGRRTFQVAQQNDALDRAQQLDRKAIAALTVEVRSLVAQVSSAQPVTVDSLTGNRRATFTIDSTPHHDTLTVTLPAKGLGTLEARIHLESASIGVRLGCGKAANGIRSASATLTGPTWLRLELGRVEEDPEICNPIRQRPGFLTRLFSSCGIGPGYAVAYRDGNWVGGPALVADCHVWP